jgi:hypothetical protein
MAHFVPNRCHTPSKSSRSIVAISVSVVPRETPSAISFIFHLIPPD